MHHQERKYGWGMAAVALSSAEWTLFTKRRLLFILPRSVHVSSPGDFRLIAEATALTSNVHNVFLFAKLLANREYSLS